ncbi:PCRF domain-containing protein [Candidatus Karelsulcia muelleri]|uniref:PCRF domain-containing protein n=1 Tax=Candidatus Karelsulcia muelleri TaxID=336810 RepID=UPI0023645196|nr:PCRF domain-containing protein [Candidatus Karelsulcia muelleri]WDE42147.1 PCRF domain-containing protein [Candidatus Karelsulcia muelleri]WDR79136.1 PCRF domain-containing protein [Candidatus Karelsulcia muelleri]
MNIKTLKKLKQIKIEIKNLLDKNLLEYYFDRIDIITDKKEKSKNDEKLISLFQKYKRYNEILYLFNKYKTNNKEIFDLTYLAYKSNDVKLIKSITSEITVLRKKNTVLKNKIKAEFSEKEIKRESVENKVVKEINSAIIELRAGTGGNEACIFVEEIFRMYSMYIKELSWKVKILNSTYSNYQGYKELIFKISGNNVYNILKYESGVHRVQRIPKTESQGRLHTSAITVAVLPKLKKKMNISLNQEEIKRESFRSRGAGGQNVNKTETAIRLTHLPTGLIAECQAERSQHKNLKQALKILKDRIFNLKVKKQLEKIHSKRKLFFSSGDRSEKIRTYNFHKGRVTDHRINKSFYNLEEFMNGKIENLLNNLKKKLR